MLLVGSLAWLGRAVFGWRAVGRACSRRWSARSIFCGVSLHRTVRRPAGAAVVHLPRPRRPGLQCPVSDPRIGHHGLDPRAVRRVLRAAVRRSTSWLGFLRVDRIEHLPEHRQRVRARQQSSLDVERRRALRARPLGPSASALISAIVSGALRQVSSVGLGDLRGVGQGQEERAASLSGAQASWCS